MIKTKTKGIFVLLLGVTLIVVAAFGFMLHQISNKIDSVTVHYAQSVKDKNVSFGNTLKKEREELSVQEKIVATKFLNENNLVEFITRLENIANQNNLKIEIEKVEKDTIEAIEDVYKIQPVSFSISINGSIEQIQAYLKEILNQKEMILIKEFKLYKNTGIAEGYNTRVILNANSMSI